MVVICALGAVVAGCGGRVTGPDGGTPSFDEPESGTGTVMDPGSPCPLLLPPAGISCKYPEGTVCAYVGGGIPCHAVLCDSTGHWQSTTDGC
jgi:hypothetical protein